MPLGSRDNARGWAVFFTLAGLAVSVVMALQSNGVYHDDDLAHLQIARWAWQYPLFFLHDWGRPGFTVLYAGPAALGWLAARLFSGVLTAATAWLAYLFARRQHIRLAALVPLLVWLQPLSFTLSYTTLTETPLALYIMLAATLYQRRRYTWSCIVISLCVVTRHDAIVYLAIWWGALLWRRQPLRVWVWIAWAPLVHNLLCLWLLPTPDGAGVSRFLHVHPSDQYGHGTLLSMLTRWVEAAGVGPLLLGLLGLPLLIVRRGGGVLVLGGLAYFAAHTLVYWQGLFETGGYARFLVPLGPLLAIGAAAALTELRRFAHLGIATRAPYLLAALAGLVWLAAATEMSRHWSEISAAVPNMQRWPLHAACGALVAVLLGAGWLATRKRRGVRRLGIRVCVVLLLLIAIGQPFAVGFAHLFPTQCEPLRLTPRQAAQREAAEWVTSHGYRLEQIVTGSLWFDEFLSVINPPFPRTTRQQIEDMHDGDVLLWDATLSVMPINCTNRAWLDTQHQLVLRWQRAGGPQPETYDVRIYEKCVPTTTPHN